MPPQELPTPTPAEVAAGLQAAADAGTIAATWPPAEAWQAEFPTLYREDAEGKYSVPYRNQGLTRHECDENSRKVQAMVRDWQGANAETSGRRSAGVETVRVRGMDGVVMHLPAANEDRIAKKGHMRPVRGRMKPDIQFWYDRHGKRWKRRRGGEWEADE